MKCWAVETVRPRLWGNWFALLSKVEEEEEQEEEETRVVETASCLDLVIIEENKEVLEGKGS